MRIIFQKENRCTERGAMYRKRPVTYGIIASQQTVEKPRKTWYNI